MIIVSSLTVGFACTCLLVSFLIAEGSADSFHTKKDRVFQLTSNDPFGSNGRLNYTTMRTIDYLGAYPEIKNICQLTFVGSAQADINGNITPITTIGVDTSFLTMFDFPVIAGAKKITPEGMMITEAKAKQLFGTTDVLGRVINLKTPDSTKLVAITGILGKTPDKSHLKFDVIIGHSVIEPPDPDRFRGGVSYVLLNDFVSPVDLAARINTDSLRPTLMGNGNLSFSFEPLDKAYTSLWNRFPYMQTRSETFIWVGWIVCGLIMFMASFNFVNLFLLLMQERKKEIGIQKTLGISIWQTLRNATMEASIYIGISFLLSMMVAYSLTPLFNSMLSSDLEFKYIFRIKVLILIVALLLLITIVIIITTTIQQRGTLPVSMMRNVSAKVRYSKLFFTIQFFVSITLCFCAITIIKQMKFIETAPLGFNRNIIEFYSPNRNSNKILADLKNRISEITGVDHVAQSQGNPISGNMIMQNNLDDGTPFNIYIFEGDNDFMKTLDLKLVEGSMDFKLPGDKIVNETFVKGLNMKDPIGKEVPNQKNESRIIGVVKDFTCSSFKESVPPVLISYKENARSLMVDYGQNDLNVLLPKIKEAWKEFFPDEPFEYKTVQEVLMKKYSEESLFYKVVLAASITSMVISCFGLFALSWAVIRSRAKEMGIRKVLGASVANIVSLLTISFAKRLLLAFVLAAPAGYYLMDLWLSRFVNKVPIDTAVFVITAIALGIIAATTLGIQTVKASVSSPLEEIRE